jgi:hypothetical protein
MAAVPISLPVGTTSHRLACDWSLLTVPIFSVSRLERRAVEVSVAVLERNVQIK